MVNQETKDKFITELERTGLIAMATKAVGLGRASIYRWLKSDKKFAERVEEALEIGRGDWCDLSESKLLLAVKRGEPWAIRYLLEFNSPRYYKPRQALKAPPVHRVVKTMDYSIVDARTSKTKPPQEPEHPSQPPK